MGSKYILPILACIGLILGLIAVIISRQEPPTPLIPFPPPSPPFKHWVAGEGIVEAASNNIDIGTPFTEIVEQVFVYAGDWVKKGDPLFKLNTEQLEASLKESEAALSTAEAEYKRQLDLPRPEDVPIYEARVKQAQSEFINKFKQYQLVEKVENPKAVSRDEYNQKRYAAFSAKFSLDEAEEELNKLVAGAWVRDLQIYRAQIKEAKAKVESVKTEIKRSTISAPFDGLVLRVNIHQGELAPAAELSEPLMIFGSVDPLRIRVDIDEEEVWRVLPGAEGVAFVRGNSSLHVPLKFIRIEPYLVPKQNITGATTERVDTRVLQIIYELHREGLPIYPGMLMDVFLEGKPSNARTTQKS